MILVDTSVWVDHLRANNEVLAELLEGAMVLAHPFVIGELALGNLRQRERVLTALSDLPQAVVATDLDVLRLVEHHRLFGRGIGHVDAHLLASVKLGAGVTLWTRDGRLNEAALDLGVAMARWTAVDLPSYFRRLWGRA